MFKIIADEAIPWLDELFSEHGEIHRYSGRELDSSMLKDADLLLIRSTLRVDKELLKHSTVKLIASATVGYDHVDLEALNELGIAFAHAPGCNANAVAEYVVCAIAWHAKHRRIDLGKALTAAIIGCGRIGSKVKRKLELLGLNVIVNDPPLALSNTVTDPAMKFVNLDEALNADVICLHTPLTSAGDFPTHHLLDNDRLRSIQDNAILINAGRGAVIDNRALVRVLDDKTKLNVVLDVWENEPDIDWELLSRINLGTPHIAGHSWRGKVMGTVMIHQQACDVFGWPLKKIDEQAFKVPLPHFKCADTVQLYDLLSNCYDIEAETAELRLRTRNKSATDAAKAFDNFRKKYYKRPEFSDLSCEVKTSLSTTIKSLGFDLRSS